MVGSGEQDYNHASLIFIAAVMKKFKFVKKMVKILNSYFQNWWLNPVREISKGAFIYDVRCFLGLFDLPHQILYYIILFSVIR